MTVFLFFSSCGSKELIEVEGLRFQGFEREAREFVAGKEEKSNALQAYQCFFYLTGPPNV